MLHDELKIEIDFKSDLRRIINSQLKSLNVEKEFIEKNNLEILLIQYHNQKLRRISESKRNVYFSKGFQYPKEHIDEFRSIVNAIKQKFETGEDVNPHLSQRIMNVDYNDDLLHEWGIHHLHLNTEMKSNGFIKRSSELLYLVIDSQNSYFINIYDHKEFQNIELLEIIEENWPFLLQKYLLNDLTSISNDQSKKGIRKSRKNNSFNIYATSSGKVYLPRGGGLNSAGSNVTSLEYAEVVIDEIQYVENFILNNKEKLALELIKQLGSCPDQLSLELKIENGGLIQAIDSNLNLVLELGNLSCY